MPSIELWVASGLLDVSVKAALLAVAAWAGMAVCRVRSSSVRHRVWTLVLVGMLLLPALVKFAPHVPLPGWLYPTLPSAVAALEADRSDSPADVQPAEGGALDMPVASRSGPFLPLEVTGAATHPVDAVEGAGAPGEAAASPSAAPGDGGITSTSREAGARSALAIAIAGIYLAGAALLLARLLIGMRKASSLVGRAFPVGVSCDIPGVEPQVEVVESTEVLVPVTIGYWHPTVVLPPDWKEWSGRSLAMVLAHEAEHVRRRDTWISLLDALNCAIYWFHPLAWLVRRRLTDLAEQACDDAVIQLTGRRNEYAENLLEMAGRLADGRGRLRPVGVAMARKANVVKRIEAIIDRDRPLSQKIGAAGAVLLVCLMAPLVFLAAGLRPANPSAAAETAALDAPSERPAEAKAAAQVLKGRVVLAGSRKPVAGAEVWLLTWKSKGLDRKTATTDASGQFEFKEFSEGRHTLAAYHENLSSRTSQYKGYEAKAGEDSIVLELREAPSLKVKVVALAGGKPIGGARVRLTWTDAKRDHLTDANGEVLIRGLTAEVWTIEVQAQGFAEDQQAVHLTGTDTMAVTANLAPGAELYGVVRDEAGKGLPGVGISVFLSGLRGQQIEYVKTAGDGSYRFEYLPITGLTLLVSKQGYAEVRPDVVIRVPPGGQQEWNMALARRPEGGSVRGTVVDGSGKPIAGASVVNRGSSSDDLRETTTDAQGRYRLDDVYKTSTGHDLFVKAGRFAPRRLQFTPGDRQHPAEVNVTLSPGHRIRGRVVDEHGSPLAGALVYYADGNRFPGIDLGGRAATDAEGLFGFDSLPADCPFAFQKDGYSQIEDRKLPLDGPQEVTVTMRSEGVIRGRVVDAGTGRPLSPFTVSVTFSPDRRPEDPSGSLSGARVLDGEKFATRDGTFRLGNFIRGMPLQVRVEAEGYQAAVVRRLVAAADRDGRPEEFRLVRIAEATLLAFAGRLLNEHGKPLPGAELRLIVASKRPFPRDRFPFNWEMIRSGQTRSTELVQQFLEGATDREGRFRFERVYPRGDIELVYWGEGVSQGRKGQLEQLSTKERMDLTVTSKTPALVRGRIDRTAYSEFSRIALSGSSGFYYATIGPAGDSYEIRNVGEGQYELQVYGPDKPRESARPSFTSNLIRRIPVTLKAGEQRTLNLEPSADRGSPAAGAKPTATAEPGRGRQEGPSKPASRQGKQAGTGSERTTRPPASASGTSEIVITGRVLDESSGAVEGARLWLPLKHDDDTRLAMATTTKTGEFTLRVPAAWTALGTFASSWTIWCHAADRRIAAASAYQQLKRNSQQPVEITLKPKTDTGFVVLDPDGKPITGAVVEPMHFLAAGYDIIPWPLRERITRKTDPEGRVAFPEMGREGFFSVQVTVEGFGIQQLRLRDLATEPAVRRISLRPTGRIEGRLRCDDKAALRSARIHVYQDDFLGEHTSGTASVGVDGDGRFAVPAFAEGEIKLIVQVEPSLPLRPRIPDNLEVYAGKTTRVDVPFERTVLVRGRVETKEDRAPVAGAMVSVQYGSFRQGDQVMTDADGRFEANVLGGPVRRQLIIRPDPYADWIVEEADFQTAIQVPAGAETFDLPPLELIATSERVGRLLDRAHRPVAAADIRAIIGNRVCAWGKTDEKGAFTLRLPKSFQIEKYDVSRSRETGNTGATVLGESPLVLQILE